MVDALEAVLELKVRSARTYLLEKLIERGRRSGAYIPFSPNTAYINTIAPHMEERTPGTCRSRSASARSAAGTAIAMVVRANKSDDELGGHYRELRSVGTLFGTGQQHFWHAPHDGTAAILIYFQGIPRRCVRALAHEDGFPRTGCSTSAVRSTQGVSSYPHPWLMRTTGSSPPCRWGSARSRRSTWRAHLKYLEARGSRRPLPQVWVFCGDGEMTSPNRSARSASRRREARQPGVRRQLQPATPETAPVRGNGTVSRTRGRFQGRGLERDQGIWGSYWTRIAKAGRHPAAHHGGDRRRRIPELTRRTTARSSQAFLRKHRRRSRWSPTCRTRHPAANLGGHDPHKV